MGPVAGLRQSRKATVALIVGLIDLATPLILFFVGKYQPAYIEDAKAVLLFAAGAVTLLGTAVIGGIAYEDGQEKKNGTHYSQHRRQAEALDLYADPAQPWPESVGMEYLDDDS